MSTYREIASHYSTGRQLPNNWKERISHTASSGIAFHLTLNIKGVTLEIIVHIQGTHLRVRSLKMQMDIADLRMDQRIANTNFQSGLLPSSGYFSESNFQTALLSNIQFQDFGKSPQEYQALLANCHHETGGFQHIKEINGPQNAQTYNYSGGSNFYARGPAQLTHDYNYKACSQFLYGDDRLYRNPDLVSQDGVVGWQTALWFWMTQTGAGSMTCHQAMAQGKFNETVRTINGALEPSEGYRNRQQLFNQYNSGSPQNYTASSTNQTYQSTGGAHLVKKDETLWDLAKQYNTTVQQLKDSNPFLKERDLWVGDELVISSSGTNTTSSTCNGGKRLINSKDNLWNLAKEYEISIEKIKDQNPFLKNRELWVGDELTIKSSNTSSTTGKNSKGNYIAKKGDFLWNLAKEYGLSIDQVKQMNPILQERDLWIGDSLNLSHMGGSQNNSYPSSSSNSSGNTKKKHVVKGDNLWDIAINYNVSVDAIKQQNPFLQKRDLWIGDTLDLNFGNFSQTPTHKHSSNTCSSHHVQKKETLWGLSQKYGVSQERIKELNPQLMQRELWAGDQIRLY